MQVKIDTKEKFHVITIQEPSLTANMTEELGSRLLTHLQSPVKNVVLNIKDIKSMDDAAAEALIHLQQRFYEKNASFVVCELEPDLEGSLDKSGLLEILNVVPTESEAYDIVQMEEIERELLGEG
jgi:anti-anti-sigma factor